jgi:hypothetical protein
VIFACSCEPVQRTHAVGLDVSASFARVTDLPAADRQTIVCPHCKKTFVGELLAGGSRHEGFKCPHCRLFVPIERANGDGDPSD